MEENPNPKAIASLNSQLNMAIANFEPKFQNYGFKRPKRAISNSCPNWPWNWYNQDDPESHEQEREGDRERTHAGTIPTCPNNQIQEIQIRVVGMHTIGQSGNFLFSKRNGRFRAGVHHEYGWVILIKFSQYSIEINLLFRLVCWNELQNSIKEKLENDPILSHFARKNIIDVQISKVKFILRFVQG